LISKGLQLISCHIGGRITKFLEGIILSREHVELYAVVQCILSAFEKQTNPYKQFLKSGKHAEMFTVKELHNTHRSTFQQASISAMLVLLIKIPSLYMLYLNFILKFQKLIAAKIDLSHIAPDIICSEVLICNGGSAGRLKCAKKLSPYCVQLQA
jgi:ABC-type sulfate transport system permease component